jgi:sulfoacetaldehyde dehydrogenase
VCGKLVGFIHDEFDKIGVDRDLVQMLDTPVSKIKAQRLMEQSDILVVTGSQNNVHRAYSSGTPAIGVGAGNVAVIVDETADIGEAARKIAASKSFDNSTSCSSENVLIVVKSVYEEFTALIADQGGILLGEDDRKKLHVALFVEGHLNREMLAKNVDVVIANANLDLANSDSARFLIIEGKGVGPQYPESGEKLSLVLTLYCASDYAHAKEIASQVMDYQGAGHSIGLHTSTDSRAVELGHQMPTCRVIVNQAHCFATGGSFDNAMPFSLSMGCGSWGGNSIDDNFNHKHLMNITKVIRTIAPDEPALESIFDEYWAKAGK